MLAGRYARWRRRLQIVRLWAIVVVSMFASAGGRAQERGGPPRPTGPGGFGPPPFSRTDEPIDVTLSKGFVFLDREYLPPPYTIREEAEGVTINGKALKCDLPESLPPRGDGPWGEGPRGDRARGEGPRPDGPRGDG